MNDSYLELLVGIGLCAVLFSLAFMAITFTIKMVFT